MITAEEFESLWKRYDGKIENLGNNCFNFWYSRHKCLYGKYDIYYAGSAFDDENYSLFSRHDEEFVITVEALNVLTTFDQDEHGNLVIKYIPDVNYHETNNPWDVDSHEICLYTIEDAYKYFDKVLAISKKLNLPSFNMKVHDKMEEYDDSLRESTDENDRLKVADIVYKPFN